LRNIIKHKSVFRKIFKKKLYMRLILSLLVLVLISSSCSTLFNGREKQVKIHTEYPATVHYQKGQTKTTNNKAFLTVKRSKDTIQFSVERDSTLKTFSVNKRISPSFWANALALHTSPLLLLVDVTNSKRFTYPTDIYMDSLESKRGYHTYERIIPQNTWELQINLPLLNIMRHTDPYGFYNAEDGFLGLGIGINYFYKGNTYFNLSAQTQLIDNGFFSFLTRHRKEKSDYFRQFSLSHNHRIKKFHVGYGISYGFHTKNYSVEVKNGEDPLSSTLYATSNNSIPKKVENIGYSVNPGIFEDKSITVRTLGLWVPISYELSKEFNLSFQYRPTFHRLNDEKNIRYEDLYSVGLAYRLRL
jgi:hypothetical protein